ncbi:MAG: GntR family transcriptional regulator [Flavobacteriaceae bacterium]|nr:GntR family transcriptional regulator [Flavobacteriaceae bacterium]
MSIILVQKNVGVPKYKQIIKSIEDGIAEGEFKQGDQLPSINHVKNRFNISRDTVLLAYSDLKERGLIKSLPGKGYFVSSVNQDDTMKVFLLFDEFNSFKEDLYNSLIQSLPSSAQVDIFFHHFNFTLFQKLILDNATDYSHYIIMPAKFGGANTVISKLPKNKVYILDQVHPSLRGYPAIYQPFEKDIFEGLTTGMPYLKKYYKLVLLFQDIIQPTGMKRGFEAFCKMNAFDNEIIDDLQGLTPEKGSVYIIPDDKNLIRVIKKIKDTHLQLGINVGIISYNDTLLKEVVADGITTISTDFKAMGKRLAKMVFHKERLHLENSCRMILRKSI